MAGVNVPQNDALESLLEKVQKIRRLRLDVLAMEDLVPRPWQGRPRPKTAIIAEAAAKAIARREAAEAREHKHQQGCVGPASKERVRVPNHGKQRDRCRHYWALWVIREVFLELGTEDVVPIWRTDTFDRCGKPIGPAISPSWWRRDVSVGGSMNPRPSGSRASAEALDPIPRISG